MLSPLPVTTPARITPLGTAMREIAKLKARLKEMDDLHKLQPGCMRHFHAHEELGLMECHILIDDDDVFLSQAWTRGLYMTERLTERERLQIEKKFLSECREHRKGRT